MYKYLWKIERSECALWARRALCDCLRPHFHLTLLGKRITRYSSRWGTSWGGEVVRALGEKLLGCLSRPRSACRPLANFPARGISGFLKNQSPKLMLWDTCIDYTRNTLSLVRVWHP